MNMTYNTEEINEFKANRFPWMGNCIITPSDISITDNMYGHLWIIRKVSDDFGVPRYELIERKKRGRKYHTIGYDNSIIAILLSIELSLWEKVPEKKPDLKRISLAYILDTPRRYHLEMIADQFLNMILPIKLEEELG